MAIADAAGNVLEVGDFVVYATGTRSSELTFAVITKIKEDRSITHYDASQYRDEHDREDITARVSLEHREGDGGLKKEMTYRDNEYVWTGGYKRTKTNLRDHVYLLDAPYNSNTLGETVNLGRYFKIDNVVPEQ